MIIRGTEPQPTYTTASYCTKCGYTQVETIPKPKVVVHSKCPQCGNDTMKKGTPPHDL